MPVVLVELFAVLGPWIARFFAAKAIVMFAGFLGRLGVVLATNEFLMQPLIDYTMSMWMNIPAEWQCWFSLFGVTKAAGIYVSGTTVLAAKHVFFAKRS